MVLFLSENVEIHYKIKVGQTKHVKEWSFLHRECIGKYREIPKIQTLSIFGLFILRFVCVYKHVLSKFDEKPLVPHGVLNGQKWQFLLTLDPHRTLDGVLRQQSSDKTCLKQIQALFNSTNRSANIHNKIDINFEFSRNFTSESSYTFPI